MAGSRAHTVLTVREVLWASSAASMRSASGAEVVVEEPGVDVEGHRGQSVAEHPLDRLDVGPAGNEEAGGAPQLGTEGLAPKLPDRRTPPPVR
jgi:hypothetical protein